MELQQLIQETINKNLLVIVEGKKDKKALENLGFKKIITLTKPIYKEVEDIKEKEVILLVDLDKEGRKIYSKLKKSLNRNHIKVDDKLRLALFKTDLRQIEGLDTYLKNQKD